MKQKLRSSSQYDLLCGSKKLAVKFWGSIFSLNFRSVESMIDELNGYLILYKIGMYIKRKHKYNVAFYAKCNSCFLGNVYYIL